MRDLDATVLVFSDWSRAAQLVLAGTVRARAGLNEDSRLGFRVSREARRAHVKVTTLFAFGVESACAPVPVRIQPEVSVWFEVAFCFRLRTDSLSRVEPNTRAVAMATSEPRAAPCCSCAETPVFFGAESIRSE